jgi:GMP synthase (glutamine-hydrolysing)
VPSVLVVQPDAEDPPELLADWLEDEGFDVRVVRPYAGEAVPEELVEDALVVLGGDMGANDVADFPWLLDVMALLRAAVSTAAPTLGICLGGQLLAASLGGRVEPGAAGMEAGVVVVHPRAEADADVLLADLPWPLRMITMHRDAITALPPDAVWLAESEPYGHQAFRVGTSAWGVQFHPEVSPKTYASWASYVTDTGEALRRVVDGVDAVERQDDVIAAGAERLARSFARLVTARIS